MKDSNKCDLAEFSKFMNTKHEFVSRLHALIEHEFGIEWKKSIERGEISEEYNNTEFFYNFIVSCLCKLMGILFSWSHDTYSYVENEAVEFYMKPESDKKYTLFSDEFLKFFKSQSNFINRLTKLIDRKLEAAVKAGVETGEISKENDNAYFSYSFCLVYVFKLAGTLLGDASIICRGSESQIIEEAISHLILCMEDRERWHTERSTLFEKKDNIHEI